MPAATMTKRHTRDRRFSRVSDPAIRIYRTTTLSSGRRATWRRKVSYYSKAVTFEPDTSLFAATTGQFRQFTSTTHEPAR